MTTVKVRLPEKLIPVFQGEADIRGAHGGRGSAKTRSFAKMIAIYGYMYGSRGLTGQLLCCRQFMNSLEDSSLEECKRAIEDEPFLRDWYEIGDRYIKSKCGRIWFAFAGLDRNIASIKSKGRILVCWVDEAEPVTEEAFMILIPTLREEGEDWNAELWLTWNPKRKSSAVEKYRKSKDPRIKIVELNHRDNPCFPATLERARQRDIEENPENYDHIWEGAYGFTQGSILGKWMAKARREGRIHNDVVFDPDGAPIVVSSDIGFRDTASWWYWQAVPGGFNLLKYQGLSGLDVDDWIPEVAKNLLEIGNGKFDKIWLPHDARAKTFQSKHTSMEKFLKAFGANKVGVVPQSRKSDQISAARSVIDNCAFNEDLCADGIDGLEAWEYVWNPDTGVFSKEPLHNFASHPADAFCYGCQTMKDAVQPQETEPTIFPAQGINGRIVTATLDELWKTVPQKDTRI